MSPADLEVGAAEICYASDRRNCLAVCLAKDRAD
jgi:hypothetical protein